MLDFGVQPIRMLEFRFTDLVQPKIPIILNISDLSSCFIHHSLEIKDEQKLYKLPFKQADIGT